MVFSPASCEPTVVSPFHLDHGEAESGLPSMDGPEEAEAMEGDEEPPRYHQRSSPQPFIHSTYDYEDCLRFPGNNRCEQRSMQMLEPLG